MASPKPRKRKKFLWFLLIFAIITAVALFSFYRKKEVHISIQKEKVALRNLTELVVASGKIQPVVQVKISPEVSGEIIELAVKEGQAVKKGDLLVKIKQDNYLASRTSAEANYQYSLSSSNTAAATLERAQLEYNRINELHENKLVSASIYQEAKTTFAIARSSLTGAMQQIGIARAALQKAEEELAKTTIYSPLSGTVTKLNSQLGERVVGTAMMAGTEIMIVSDLMEMETRVDIGEIDVVLIEVGQKARLEVDAFKDKKFTGVVTEIANSAKTTAAQGNSSSTGEATKFEVKIRITEKEVFRPGMSVTAEIETRSRTNVLTIPIQCVTTRMPKGTNDTLKASGTNAAGTNITNAAISTNANGVSKEKKEETKAIEVVFVVEGDRVKMVPVKRGISDDNYVEIEGLKEGQEVVTGTFKAINRELEDGKTVTVGSGKSSAESKKDEK